MNEKKIEPTEEMVDEAANMLSLHATGMSLRFQDGADKHTYRHRARVALRVALNRPAAPGLFADEDAIRAAREQGWDDAAQHIYNKGWEGVTALRRANPHRPAPELPPERDGVVLVPADGHKAITTTDGQKFSRLTFTTKRSIWYGPNLAAQLGDLVIQTTVADRLTPGTWKVADQ